MVDRIYMQIPNSHLSLMNTPMAAVVVAAAMRTTLWFGTSRPISTIAIVVVTRRRYGKRVGRARPYMLPPIHD